MTKVTVALEPIDQRRVVVKELVLVGERKIGDRRAEAVINRLERADDAVDRKVTREHAALGAENLDGVADDRAVRRQGPRQARLAEAGKLDRDIRMDRGPLQRAAPAGESFDAAIVRQARMHDDDLRP